jgi:methionyl-tRNA formyltransferase
MSAREPAVYFVGAGALLHHAADYSLNAGLPVAGILSPPGDAAAPKLRARGLSVLESVDPNQDLPRLIGLRSDGIVFSINNRQIIKDELLAGDVKFFNVHNGLVQDYRGIAEVCIFAALCAGNARYGATLQRLLPRHKVDSGPVVAQIEFPVGPNDRFCDVLPRSLEACRDLFESQVRAIASNRCETRVVGTSKAALRYEDVASLCAAADPARLTRARDLGRYRGLLPRLASLIESSLGASTPGASTPGASTLGASTLGASTPGASRMSAPVPSGAERSPS